MGLPLPPRRNELEAMHPIHKGKRKNAYRARVWVAAIQQHKPSLEPPEHVHLKTMFHVKRAGDEDGYDLKWLLDTFGQKQKTGWRQGIADLKGFYIDDDPAHLTWDRPLHVVDPDNVGVDIIMEWGPDVPRPTIRADADAKRKLGDPLKTQRDFLSISIFGAPGLL
jgi:hypothetical protein